MSTYVAPRALRAIEQPPEIDRLLAIWGQAFDDKAIPVRARPRLKPMGPGRREGFTQWGAKVGGMEMHISLEEVTSNRWRIDHNNQGALALLDGRPALLRQWYVKRAPTDASLTAAEIAQLTEEAPFYVTPGVHRGTPTERRLYQLVAMLDEDVAAIREQTNAAIARHNAALEKFGF